MVGLANPGAQFAGTRHNVGADVVLALADRSGTALKGERGQQAVLAEVKIADRRVALAVPSTYMNESGTAVRALVRRFGIEDLDHLVVVHDELDLPPGRIRIKVGGGNAGHNGLRSLQAHLHSTEFVRIRVGIGKPPGQMAGADYVLRRPSHADQEALDVAVARAADAVEAVVTEGADAAMNRFNGVD